MRQIKRLRADIEAAQASANRIAADNRAVEKKMQATFAGDAGAALTPEQVQQEAEANAAVPAAQTAFAAFLREPQNQAVRGAYTQACKNKEQGLIRAEEKLEAANRNLTEAEDGAALMNGVTRRERVRRYAQDGRAKDGLTSYERAFDRAKQAVTQARESLLAAQNGDIA